MSWRQKLSHYPFSPSQVEQLEGMFLIVVLLSAILIGPSQAPYPPQKCFICEGDDCNSAKAQDCPTDLNDDKSGKAFVNKAFNANNAGATVAANYATFVNGLGFPTPPTWEQLTRYVPLDLLF